MKKDKAISNLKKVNRSSKRLMLSLLTFFVLLGFSLLTVTSCTTSIALKTLVPAEMNITGYKTIAVQSTTYKNTSANVMWRNFFIPIKGPVEERYLDALTIFSLFEGTTLNEVSRHSSNNIVRAIDKGFYTITNPSVTDSLITVGKNTGTVRQTLLNNGVDAILTSSIDYLNYEEYITCEPVYAKDGASSSASSTSSSSSSGTGTSSDGKTVTGYMFYLNQSASISLTYSIIDVENNVLIGSDTLSASTDLIKTLIGHTNDAKEFVCDTLYLNYIKASDLFDGLLDGFVSTITKKLTPHYETSYFNLMENKPKVESLTDAYKYVDNGNYRTALDLFLAEYNRSGHVPSGYNAAILYYTLGQYEDAFNLSEAVYKESGNSTALNLYYRLKSVWEKQKAATDQISGTQKGATTQTELIGF